MKSRIRKIKRTKSGGNDSIRVLEDEDDETEAQKNKRLAQRERDYMNDDPLGEKLKYKTIYDKNKEKLKRGENKLEELLFDNYIERKYKNKNKDKKIKYADRIKELFETLFPIGECNTKEKLKAHFSKIINCLISREIYKKYDEKKYKKNQSEFKCVIDRYKNDYEDYCYDIIIGLIVDFNYNHTDEKLAVKQYIVNFEAIYNYHVVGIPLQGTVSNPVIIPSYLSFFRVDNDAKDLLENLKNNVDLDLPGFIDNLPPNNRKDYNFNKYEFAFGIPITEARKVVEIAKTFKQMDDKINKDIEEANIRIEDTRYSLFQILMQMINILFCSAGRISKSSCIEGNVFGKHGFLGTMEKLANCIKGDPTAEEEEEAEEPNRERVVYDLGNANQGDTTDVDYFMATGNDDEHVNVDWNTDVDVKQEAGRRRTKRRRATKRRTKHKQRKSRKYKKTRKS